MILFSYEQTRHTHLQLPVEIELEICKITDFLTASDNHPTPESRSMMELRLFQRLVALSRNLEMDRMFELSVERLYWQANIRRWKAPYLTETAATLTELLSALTNQSNDIPSRLFAYLKLLKKTWV
jgi:hypothetical protein